MSKSSKNAQNGSTELIDYLRTNNIKLPKFSELANPLTIPQSVVEKLKAIEKNAADPINLYRVHWYNDEEGLGFDEIPGFIEIPKAISGTNASIVVMLGERFPMVSAHKVLAAYTCLVPRLLEGSFDPTYHRAVWPSTGNYCRGGVAISKILGCRSIAVLPEGMSKERFDWLESWVTNPSDIIRTYGTESNVKEIYDECARLGRDDQNIVINQFAEFGNYVGHYYCTGQAAAHIFRSLRETDKKLKLSAFVSATGSAGTLAAGDYLKEQFGSKNVAVEAVECPTMLHNGFGEHNIQGIGDKHLPFIHNVMNTDTVVGISDQSSDGVYLLLNTEEGRSYLKSRCNLSDKEIQDLSKLGLSGVANVLAACRYARHFDLNQEHVVITVATDSSDLYRSQIDSMVENKYQGAFDALSSAEIFGRHLMAIDGSELLDLTYNDQKRIFNLGYYTWVEQQGVTLDDFEARRSQEFWKSLSVDVEDWDQRIESVNEQVDIEL